MDFGSCRGKYFVAAFRAALVPPIAQRPHFWEDLLCDFRFCLLSLDAWRRHLISLPLGHLFSCRRVRWATTPSSSTAWDNSFSLSFGRLLEADYFLAIRDDHRVDLALKSPQIITSSAMRGVILSLISSSIVHAEKRGTHLETHRVLLYTFLPTAQ